MDWIEVVGGTVSEAKEQALDVLGVDEHEAEIEVLEEPKQGLFGRVRGNAKVRARVTPVTPRPKVDTRERRRRGGTRSKGRDGQNSDAETTSPSESSADRPAAKKSSGGGRGRGGSKAKAKASSRSGGNGGGRAPKKDRADAPEGKDKPVTVTVEQQGEQVREFLEGLGDAFGVDSTAVMNSLEEDLVEVTLDSDDDIGLLIGPKGATVTAVHELAKAVVQRKSGGDRAGRFRIDIGGYRARRREALVKFTQGVADKVLDSDTSIAMEAMGASDRKVVHDTVNDIDGLRTTSEGQEPQRRVVIHPDGDE